MAADKQRKPLTARGRFWQGHVQRWRQSGLSQAQYCRQQQLSAPAFGWWKQRLGTTRKRVHPVAAQRETGAKDGSFVELTHAGSRVPVPVGAVVYEIVLPAHRCLRLGPGFELERVRQLLDLLERSC